MNFSEENIALFDAYLRNEMTDLEKLAFEKKLSTTPHFKKEFDEFKTFEKAIEYAEIKSFKQKLKTWDNSIVHQPNSNRPKVIRLRIISAVAAVAIIALISSTFFFNTSDKESLVANNFQPYDNIITVRGEQADIDMGLHFYDLQEYSKAIEQLEKHPNNSSALFYAAESHLALKNYKEAAEKYELLLTQKNSLFDEIIRFHLGLAYIGMDKNDQAIEMLNSVKGDFKTQAAELIDDLR